MMATIPMMAKQLILIRPKRALPHPLALIIVGVCVSLSATGAAEQPKRFTIEFLVVEMSGSDFQRVVVERRLGLEGPQRTVKEVKIKADKMSYNAPQERWVIDGNPRDVLAAYRLDNAEEVQKLLNGNIGRIVTRPRVAVESGVTGRVRLGSDIPFRYLKQENDGRFHVETLTVPEGYDIEMTATPEKDDRVTLMATIKVTFIKDRTPLSGAPEILAGPPMLSARTMQTVLSLKEGELVCLGGLVQTEKDSGQPGKATNTACFCRLIPRGEAAATRPPGANLKEVPSNPEMRDLTLTGSNPVSLARPLSSAFSSEVLEQVLKPVVKVEARFDRNRETSDGPILTSVTSLSAGFIVRADGYIVTASSAVSGTSEVKVTLSDGRTFSAQVRGRDSATGVAVLRVDSTDLPALKWADDENTRIGQPVFTFGHPEGMDNTLLTGIVTAVKRRLPSGLVEDVVDSHEALSGSSNVPVLHNLPIVGNLFRSKGTTNLNPSVPLVQTNLPISPGCSGGPVCDSTGAVIGMSIARYLPPSSVSSIPVYDQFGKPASFYQVGEAAPISFAVPVTELRRAVDEIIEKGKVARAWLGVAVYDRKPNGQSAVRGTKVKQVIPNSPAEKAGLRVGDVIQIVEGQEVTCAADLEEMIAARRPGDVVHLTLLREGKGKQVAVQLGELMWLSASSLREALVTFVKLTRQPVLAGNEALSVKRTFMAWGQTPSALLMSVAMSAQLQMAKRQGYSLLASTEQMKESYPPRKASLFLFVGDRVGITVPKMTRVFMANPKVAEPVVVAADKVSIKAIVAGTTSLVIDTEKEGKWDWVVNVFGDETATESVTSGTEVSEKKIQLNCENASAKDVLRLLATTSGKTIVLAPEVGDTKAVSVKLEGVTLEEALRVICESSGLKYRREGDVYHVTTR